MPKGKSPGGRGPGRRKPKRMPRRPVVETQVLQRKAKLLATFFKQVEALKALEPLDVDDVMKHLEKRNVDIGGCLKLSEEPYGGLIRKYLFEGFDLGQAKIAITRTEEAFDLKKIRLFVQAVEEAKQKRLF